MKFTCRICKKTTQQAICPKCKKSNRIIFEKNEEQIIGSIYHEFQETGTIILFHDEYQPVIEQLKFIGAVIQFLFRGRIRLKKLDSPFWMEVAFNEMRHNAF